MEGGFSNMTHKNYPCSEQEMTRVRHVNDYILNESIYKCSKPFDYRESTKLNDITRDVLSQLSLKDTQMRINYCQDKVKNIDRLKHASKSKPTFGAIEARQNLEAQFVQLIVVDVTGRKEMFIRVNLFQNFRAILDKTCERFGKDTNGYELVYNNSTMWLDDMVGGIVQNDQSVYLFPK